MPVPAKRNEADLGKPWVLLILLAKIRTPQDAHHPQKATLNIALPILGVVYTLLLCEVLRIRAPPPRNTTFRSEAFWGCVENNRKVGGLLKMQEVEYIS